MAVIRKATEGDIPCLLDLLPRLALGPPPVLAQPSPKKCREVLEHFNATPGLALLVAEEEGRVVGTAILVIVPSLWHGASPFAVVEHLVVDEARRGRGIGRQLMEYAVKKADEAGCYKIMLCSNKKREDAHRFYRSLGFAATHEGFHRYY